MLYKARNSVTEIFDGCYSMVSEVKLKANKLTGLEILTPKQMFQRLSTALPKVKAGNNSENSLN